MSNLKELFISIFITLIILWLIIWCNKWDQESRNCFFFSRKYSIDIIRCDIDDLCRAHCTLASYYEVQWRRISRIPTGNTQRPGKHSLRLCKWQIRAAHIGNSFLPLARLRFCQKMTILIYLNRRWMLTKPRGTKFSPKNRVFQNRLFAPGSHKNVIASNKQITREIQRLTHCSRCKSRTDNRRNYVIIARGALPVTFCRVKLSEGENSPTGRESAIWNPR
jgi:hypothetical protein